MKRLLLALASTLVGLLLLEGSCRAWLAIDGRPHRASEVAEEMRRVVDPTGRFLAGDPAPLAQRGQGGPILHPYAGTEAYHDTGGVLAAFHRGFDEGDVTIVAVGGSVASEWVREGGPRFLEHLRGDPLFEGRRVHLLNYAHPSYKQPQQLMRLAYLFSLGHRPDAVLSLDGFNEVALSLQNLSAQTHPVYPPPPVWGAVVARFDTPDGTALAQSGALYLLNQEARALAERSLQRRLHHSSVLGGLTLARLRRIDHRRNELQAERIAALAQASRGGDLTAIQRQRRGPDFDMRPRWVLLAGARNWFESSLSIEALCRARGVPYVHVLQPTLHDAGAKPFAPEEQRLGPVPLGWDVGAREGYPLLRAEGERLRAAGVVFHDASRLFESEQRAIYYDHCHLNPLGNELLADEIAAAFLAALRER